MRLAKRILERNRKWPLLTLFALLTLGAARDCRTGTLETGGAPVLEAEANVTLESQVAALAVKVGKIETHVNTVDSWTSIILAISVGGSSFVYIVGHRFKWFRATVDRAKGKP